MGRDRANYDIVRKHHLMRRATLYWQMQVRCRPIGESFNVFVHLGAVLVAAFSLFDMHSALVVKDGACCQARAASYGRFVGWLALAMTSVGAGPLLGLSGGLVAVPGCVGMISAAACLDALLTARRFSLRPHVVLTDLVRRPGSRRGAGRQLVRSVSASARKAGKRVGGVAMNERLAVYYVEAGLRRDEGADPRLVVG